MGRKGNVWLHDSMIDCRVIPENNLTVTCKKTNTFVM